jgi:Phage integrase family
VSCPASLAAAGLRSLRFHDLGHTFGTRMIAKADIRRVQDWIGHADIQTTMRYRHFAPRDEDVRLVAEAFEVKGGGAAEAPGLHGKQRESVPSVKAASVGGLTLQRDQRLTVCRLLGC